MAEPEQRTGEFDGIRALAFLAVFMHHAVGMPLGWMGVDVFFVLSGFLITRMLLGLRSEAAGAALRQFFLRRVLRIVPPYYLALTMIYLAYPALRSGAPWYYGFASNVFDGVGPQWLGISHDAGGGPLRAMWSIAVEAQFYVVWPWLVLFLPRRGLVVLFVSLIVAAPLVRVLVQGVDRQAVYRLTPCRMDLLAGGAFLAHVVAAHPRRVTAHRGLAAVVAGMSAALFSILSAVDTHFRSLSNSTSFNTIGYTLSMVLCAALLLYVCASPNGLLVRVLRTSALRYLGRISYMTYLTHLFFLQLVVERLGSGRWLSAALGLFATLSFSSLTWFGLERPLSRLRSLVASSPHA